MCLYLCPPTLHQPHFPPKNSFCLRALWTCFGWRDGGLSLECQYVGVSSRLLFVGVGVVHGLRCVIYARPPLLGTAGRPCEKHPFLHLSVSLSQPLCGSLPSNERSGREGKTAPRMPGPFVWFDVWISLQK
eukprot:RCo020250